MEKLPELPRMRPVCLEDRAFLEATFRAMRPDVSELNFTNIFMFSHVHHYQISSHNGNILIYARSYAGKPYFLAPIGDNNIPGTLTAMMEFMVAKGEPPHVELAWKGFVDGYIARGHEYAWEANPDNADYVYDTRELIELTGRKFHKKKNHLNRFLREYGPVSEYKRLTPELVAGAKDLTERWCQEKCTVETPSTYGETEATMRALDNMESLSTVGGVVLVNGRVEGLSLGEELNPDTVVIHVEKANSEFVGLYQYLSSEFLRNEFPGYKYTNREQDLGEPNLRHSKQSNNPIAMVEKYRVWPRKA
ncbi:MAG: DUF2156 domain-containing protein [Nitrospirae bacterium]|nr:DUF2156 domain-containing protein [Nitrospirota bacterium]